jgi:hypothetical protein
MKIFLNLFITLLLILGGTNINSQQQTSIDSLNFNVSLFSQFDYNNFDRKELYNQLIPKNEYAYFEVRTADGYDTESYVTSIGDSSKFSQLLKSVTTDQGFFNCSDHYCGSYIVAITEDESIEIIDSDSKLQSFIGEIDNIEEVLLFCRANKLYNNPDTLIANSYLERSNDYLLYLFDSHSCPVTHYSIRAQLAKTGELTVFDRIKIYESEDCNSH